MHWFICNLLHIKCRPIRFPYHEHNTKFKVYKIQEVILLILFGDIILSINFGLNILISKAPAACLFLFLSESIFYISKIL